MKHYFVFLCCFCSSFLMAQTPLNIKDFGAKGDSSFKNTIIIQKLIDSANAVGGGTVLIPKGVFVTGTIKMKSNVCLFLERGAKLCGATDKSDYPLLSSKYKFVHDSVNITALIFADHVSNISITGYGTIDGVGGAPLFDYRNKIKLLPRPMIIRFVKCNNVLINGTTLKNSANWVQQYVVCTNVKIQDINVHSFVNKNNDGLDIVGGNNISISGSTIYADDDGICLKTLTTDPLEYVTITNCIIASNCNAIKMGTESLGDFKNIVITNCVIRKSGVMIPLYMRDIGLCGIALETVDGADVENIIVSDIVISGVYTPLFVRLGNRARGQELIAPDQKKVGTMKNIAITNITGIAERPPEASITGIPGHNIEGLTLQNISITIPGGYNKMLIVDTVPECEKDYPEVKMFGSKLPSYGLFIRHVRNLTLNNVRLYFIQEDVRPAIIFDDVKHVVLNNVKCNTTGQSKMIRIINSSDFSITLSGTLNTALAFLSLEGKSTSNIRISDCDLSLYKNAIDKTDELLIDSYKIK